MVYVEGKHGIYAKVLAHSISTGYDDSELISFELQYPRIILSELNTHRMLSKNSASSRAIPFEKMVKQLTGRPVRFGQANPGMQDKGTDFEALICDPQRLRLGPVLNAEEAWDQAQKDAAAWSEKFYKAGYHKQIYNRLTEPFQMMKTVLSGTELANFFWLRNHSAADPTLEELARCIFEAKQASTPVPLMPGEWHLPYVETQMSDFNTRQYFIEEDDNVYPLTAEVARQVSAARCAAVSFRNVDYGVGKSKEVFEKLVGDDRKHASAFEHQATPMDAANSPWQLYNTQWEEGISHVDRYGRLWSGNFRGWIQHRKLIPGENKEE